MKALVTVKRMVDYDVKVRVKADRSDVDINNVKMSMNPFDGVAVEEAVRLREAGEVSEIIAVSLGNKKCEETLRAALATGADRTVHIKTDEKLEPLTVAKLLKILADKENPQILLLGKQTIDDGADQTIQMLPALLNAAQGASASKIELSADRVLVTRKVDGGEETLALKLPAAISTDLRLNEPRFVKLSNIIQAKKKPLEKLSLGELGTSIVPLIHTIKVTEPRGRQADIKVDSVTELADRLRNETKVI